MALAIAINFGKISQCMGGTNIYILEGERKSKHKKGVGLLVYSGVKEGSTPS